MSWTLNVAAALHKARHAVGGPDAIAPADIGAETAGAAAAAQAAAAADATDKVAAVTVTTLGAITPASVDTKITTERGTERAYQSSTYAPTNVVPATGVAATDTAALTAALATPGIKRLSGHYITNAAIPLITGLRLVGSGNPDTYIANYTGDLFSVAGTVNSLSIEDLGLVASAGHIFNVATSASLQNPIVRHCSLTQISTSKSIWSQIGPNTGNLINLLVEDCTQNANPAASVPPWDIVGNNGGLNGNNWVRGTFNANGATPFTTVPFVRMEEQGTGPNYCSDNHITNVVAEYCAAGVATFLSSSDCSVEGTAAWDVTTYTGSLFTFGKSAVSNLNSLRPKVINSGRRGGALSGVYDVDVSNANYAWLQEAVPMTGAPSYNLNTGTLGYTVVVSGVTQQQTKQAFSFVNSWADDTAAFGQSTVGYRLTTDLRHVEFFGAIQSGTTGTVATLPAAFRPPAAKVFLLYNAATGGTAYMVINSAGVVTVSVSAAGTILVLDGVVFPIDQ